MGKEKGSREKEIQSGNHPRRRDAGKDVVGATRLILDTINSLAEDFALDFYPMEAGASQAVARYGSPFPSGDTGRDRSDGHGFFRRSRSPYDFVVLSGIRTGFSLYANVRPIKSLPGIRCIQPKADIIIVRETRKECTAVSATSTELIMWI